MSDHSNYKSLVPSPALERRGAAKEEGENCDELRVCPVCEELFVRYVVVEVTLHVSLSRMYVCVY